MHFRTFPALLNTRTSPQPQSTLDATEEDTMQNLNRALDLVGCPACSAPAEIVDRFVLESTDGPIEHAIVLCAVRHRFTVLVERLGTPHLSGKGAGRWTPSPPSS